MYVNSVEWDKFKPLITGAYGSAVNCTLTGCYFDTGCEQVVHHNT